MPYDTYFFWVFRDRNGWWRWRLYAPNEEILAIPGQGFHTRQACEKNISLVKRVAPDAPVRYQAGAR